MVMKEQILLSKKEKFICEMIWGSIPTDLDYIRNSKLFQEGIIKFELGEWKNLWKLENKQYEK